MTSPEDVTTWVRQYRSIAVGPTKAAGAAARLQRLGDDASIEVSGRDLVTGLPRSVTVSRREMRSDPPFASPR